MVVVMVWLSLNLLVKLMTHSISLDIWTPLAITGSFFLTLILMTIGVTIKKATSRIKQKNNYPPFLGRRKYITSRVKTESTS